MKPPGPEDGDGVVPPSPAGGPDADDLKLDTSDDIVLTPAADEPVGLDLVDSLAKTAESALLPPLKDLAPDAPRVAAPPPPPAPVVAAAAAATEPAKPRARASYTDEPPSIATDRVRDPGDLPQWATVPDRPARSSRPARPPRWRRPALLVALGLLLAGAAWTAYERLRPQPPVLTSIVPAKAEAGQTVTLAGANLGTDVSDVVVRFGERRGVVTSTSGTSLSATVPAELASAPPGDVQVRVEVKGADSNALFMNLARFPRITSVTPEVALPGDEVTLEGANLVPEASVRIGGFAAAITGPAANGLRVEVPEMPVVEGKELPVDVTLGRDSARPATLVLGHLPLAVAVDPATGPAGSIVTVKGLGFGPSAADNRVSFGGADALVLAAGPREIKAAVPAFGLTATQSALPVVVTTGGARSSVLTFTATRPSGDVFRPRFAAAPAPGGEPSRHAIVGTEMGPVLVLTSGATAAADRAVRAAAHLNALMDAAASRAVTIEARDTAVVAGRAAIVEATGEDAATLSRGWAGAPAARVSPLQLARYWAALLHDYVGLFGRRERPNRAIELTPRARVLLDVYADAERRGGSMGVATPLVTAMTAERSAALRQLAFAAPAEGQGAGALALAGAWEGSMEDGGLTRRIGVRFGVEGARLGGALTSSAGGVSMAIPLQDLRYDKGMVRFSVVLAGVARQFRGQLEGATLTGTIHHDAGAAAGTFSLRHQE